MDLGPGIDTQTSIGRLTETISLGLVASAATVLASTLMGVQDSVLLVAFVVAWLAPAARRLSEFRRGLYSPLRIRRTGYGVLVTLIAGTGPWALLIGGYRLFPAAAVWVPSTFPIWMNGIGVALALVTVAWSPRADYGRDADCSSFVPRLTPYPQVLTLALLLISGSLAIGIIFLVWLASIAAVDIHHGLRREPSLPGGSLQPVAGEAGLNSPPRGTIGRRIAAQVTVL